MARVTPSEAPGWKIGGALTELRQKSTQRKTVSARGAGIAMPAPVAALGDRTVGYAATVTATLSFGFFLTRLYERLEITERVDLETAICLFAVGVVVTEILLQSRRFHRAAREESSFVGLIHRVAELVASGAQRDDVTPS